MPLEIKELVIKARVDETNNSSLENRQEERISHLDIEAIVAACVEQVLQILADKKER